ncbi:Uncharacterised protein [uncultured archaeon]|nr:Uncharacterised protein [uncultured archaeon]
MTINKIKQDQIPILLSQGKKLQEIADELGISVGAVWNYKMGNHPNKKREPSQKVVPPRLGFIPKEPVLSATTGNTISEYLAEPNIRRPEYYTEMQLLRNAEIQDRQQEQNRRVAIESLTQQVKDLAREKAREREHQELLDRSNTEVERLLKKTQEEQDQATIKKMEIIKDQISQDLNKPKESPRETRATHEILKSPEEQPKINASITQPQSSPSNIKINNPDIVSEGLISREKPLAKPPEIQTNSSIELKKTSHDNIGIDWLKIIIMCPEKEMILFSC